MYHLYYCFNLLANKLTSILLTLPFILTISWRISICPIKRDHSFHVNFFIFNSLDWTQIKNKSHVYQPLKFMNSLLFLVKRNLRWLPWRLNQLSTCYTWHYPKGQSFHYHFLSVICWLLPLFTSIVTFKSYQIVKIEKKWNVV